MYMYVSFLKTTFIPYIVWVLLDNSVESNSILGSLIKQIVINAVITHLSIQ